MKNRKKNSFNIHEESINTTYPESEAIIYDQKRFSDPKGKLFNKLEMQQLERVLYVFSSKQRILEVGCGTGRFMLKCLENGHEVHGLDPSPSMVTKCREKMLTFEKVYYYLGEGAKMPFKNNEFNFVFSIRTLNQVSSKSYAFDMVREMIRVCRNEGIVLLEFVNRYSISLHRKRTVRLSINDINSILKEYKGSLEIVNISGILFFAQTLMNLMPISLLSKFEKIDAFFSKMFPMFSTRCYVTIKKKGGKYVRE